MKKCPECQEQFDSSLKMLAHARYVHKFNQETVYRKLHSIVDNPVCECGCEALVPYITFSVGYRKYARGHASRVKNNFNSEKSMTNSIKKRREMLKDGTWKPYVNNETGTVWNSGLTKEDPRVAKQIAKRETAEYKEKSSKRMKENRLSGKIPTLKGSKHSQWNGGTSPLLNVCHANKQLFENWKYPILEKSNFTCSSCGNQNRKGNAVDLHVHHDKIQMATIVHLIAEREGWTQYYGLGTAADDPSLFEIKTKISNGVAEYHINNDISGVVLCKKCHSEKHDKYNF